MEKKDFLISIIVTAATACNYNSKTFSDFNSKYNFNKRVNMNTDLLHTDKVKSTNSNYASIDISLNSYDSYANNTFFNDYDKVNIILNFAKEMIDNSESIDPEFVDIVDNNFWDLF